MKWFDLVLLSVVLAIITSGKVGMGFKLVVGTLGEYSVFSVQKVVPHYILTRNLEMVPTTSKTTKSLR